LILLVIICPVEGVIGIEKRQEFVKNLNILQREKGFSSSALSGQMVDENSLPLYRFFACLTKT